MSSYGFFEASAFRPMKQFPHMRRSHEAIPACEQSEMGGESCICRRAGENKIEVFL